MSEKEREAAATLHVTQRREATLHLARANLPTPKPSPTRPPPPAPGACIMAPPSPVVTTHLPDTPSYWQTLAVTAAGPPLVRGIPQGVMLPPPKPKSVLEAYLLGLVFGALGAHHFYLGRTSFGVLYLLSFGLLGWGWFVDLLRMPCLVQSVNRKNREKYEQLLTLQQQLAQQRQQQQQQQPGHQQHLPPHNVVFVAFEPKSLGDAYVLWFPCGILGFHHFYLRNYGMGFLYLCTLGLLGIGWLVDLFRMPSLVKKANSCAPISSDKQYSQCTAHILAFSPVGILGGHHYYLDRPVWGLLYTVTLGLMGVGWVVDWFRTSVLVKRANSIRQGLTSPNRKYVDDAYVLCFPFGFTGLYHFYLRRYGWGCLYFFTFGILGLGWLVDWFRLPCLVKDCNASEEDSCNRILVHSKSSSSSFSSVVVDAGSGSGGVRNYGMPAAEGQQVTVVMSGLGQPQSFGAPPGAPGLYPSAAAAACDGYGYHGYQGGYPAMTANSAEPCPTYMVPEGGAAMVYPPQYSAHLAPAANLPPTDQDQAPPPYEAAADNQTTLTRH